MAGARAAAPFVFAVGLALAIAAIGRPAQAHAVGVSRGEYVLTGAVVTAALTFAPGDADGLDSSELVRGVTVSANGKSCAGVFVEEAPAAPDAVTWRARFTCEQPRGEIVVAFRPFDELAPGHRHVAHLQAGQRAADDVLYRRHDTLSLAIGESTVPPPAPGMSAPLAAMLRMGVEHILTGYDHLVFLLGLMVVGGRPRSLLAVVTAFTVAHSITLALAVLGVWAPPPRLVEPAIALSIAYVGVENFFIQSADQRWRVTFPFGLLHGFGFAGALRAVALPRAAVPAALLSFNLGVELGQLTVLAALLPLLAWLRRSNGFANFGVRALSAAIVAMGGAWFVARIVGAQS
jgi:HupE/UreJ protein